jgi:hypothetical protein
MTAPGIPRGDLNLCNRRSWSFAGAAVADTPQTSVPAPDVGQAPALRSRSGRSVVGVAFERDGWIFPLHPEIERIVEKEIRQHGADNSPLRGTAPSVNQVPIRHAHGRPQPPFKVEQNPWAVRVPSHSPHQEVPIDFIEETLDVEVEHPVISPATLPGFGEGVMC